MKLKEKAVKLKIAKIEFPFTVNKINIYEKNQVTINVFSLNDILELYHLRTSNEKFEFCINLLLISNENTNYYVLRKSLSPFMNNSQNN